MAQFGSYQAAFIGVDNNNTRNTLPYVARIINLDNGWQELVVKKIHAAPRATRKSKPAIVDGEIVTKLTDLRDCDLLSCISGKCAVLSKQFAGSIIYCGPVANESRNVGSSSSRSGSKVDITCGIKTLEIHNQKGVVIEKDRVRVETLSDAGTHVVVSVHPQPRMVADDLGMGERIIVDFTNKQKMAICKLEPNAGTCRVVATFYAPHHSIVQFAPDSNSIVHVLPQRGEEAYTQDLSKKTKNIKIYATNVSRWRQQNRNVPANFFNPLLQLNGNSAVIDIHTGATVFNLNPPAGAAAAGFVRHICGWGMHNQLFVCTLSTNTTPQLKIVEFYKEDETSRSYEWLVEEKLLPGVFDNVNEDGEIIVDRQLLVTPAFVVAPTEHRDIIMTWNGRMVIDLGTHMPRSVYLAESDKERKAIAIAVDMLAAAMQSKPNKNLAMQELAMGIVQEYSNLQDRMYENERRRQQQDQQQGSVSASAGSGEQEIDIPVRRRF